jgi:hypothetical protein
MDLRSVVGGDTQQSPEVRKPLHKKGNHHIDQTNMSVYALTTPRTKA